MECKDARTRVVQRGAEGVRLTKIATAHGVCLLLWAGKDDKTTADAAWSGRTRGRGGCSRGKGKYDCTKSLRHTEGTYYFGRGKMPRLRWMGHGVQGCADAGGAARGRGSTIVQNRYGTRSVPTTLGGARCPAYGGWGMECRMRGLGWCSAGKGEYDVQDCYGTRSVPATLGGLGCRD